MRTGQQAFEILVRDHHRRILAYAQSLVSDSHLAEDLVQESFLTAYLNLDRFDSTRDFGAWVRGIVRMKYREMGRQRRELPLDEATLEAVESQYSQWDLIREQDGPDVFDIVQSCLKMLPELLQKIVRSFYFDQMSCESIASHISKESTR